MAVRLGVPENTAGQTLERRLAWVTAARVAFLTLCLGAFAAINVRKGFTVGETSGQIVVATLAGAFALAALYAGVLRRGRRLVELATAQLLLDQVTWTILVYLTGGAASGATSLYGLTCLLGAFLIGLRGSIIAGVSGIALYVSVGTLLYSGHIAPPDDQPISLYAIRGQEFSYHVLVNVLVLVIVTMLTSYLADRLGRAAGRLVEAEERAERAERLAVLGRLATALAHEIRNPLGSIAGSAQLLRTSRALSEEDRHLCEIIQRETARLNDLVTDMMDVARPRKPELVTVNATRTAREVVDLASKSGRGTDVHVVFDGEEVLAVKADPAQLRQLVWNLVRNAVQASNAGGEVRVGVQLRDGNVVLSVQDGGIGIEPEARERLFDAFFTTRSHGTGIGLAVVKRIADEHGFAIEVDSERGAGATFRVTMGPRYPLSGESPALPAHRSSVPPPP
jgi:signal transduction histidine kinase